jgi:hypothetical protein
MNPFSGEHHESHVDFQRNKFSRLLTSFMLTEYQPTQMERYHYTAQSFNSTSITTKLMQRGTECVNINMSGPKNQ